jgi:hypothetical protein
MMGVSYCLAVAFVTLASRRPVSVRGCFLVVRVFWAYVQLVPGDSRSEAGGECRGVSIVVV